jgi:rare lipoprotein A (peptidoglycan hydrolase)
MNRVLSIVMAALVLVASVGAAPVPDHPISQVKTKNKASQPGPRPYQVGNASWYGKKFYGRATASGEDFDMFDLTAAHRRLPLGTYVKVTNLRNGKWVIVRVNDRGPYVRGRIMDLSYSAARMLDFHAGVEKVRLDIVEPETVASIRHFTD